MFHIRFSLISIWPAFLGVLLFVQQPKAQDITEYGSLDSLAVGDTFTYTVVLHKDRSYDDILFPDSSDITSPFEIRARQHYRVTDFRDSLVYRLQFFGTEDTLIPELPVLLVAGTDTSQVHTRPVPVYFKSILSEEQAQSEFRPLKPIFDFALAWWPYLLGLIILGAAAWYYYRYHYQKEATPEPAEETVFTPTPFLDPLRQLGTKLNELRDFAPTGEDEFKEFYIRLGDAIREYFEELYKIPALELSSRELLHELNKRSVDGELVEKTRDVLREADMVKFARFTPTAAQAGTALEKADAFLNRANEIDRPRVEQLRREHTLENERRKAAFESKRKRQGEQA